MGLSKQATHSEIKSAFKRKSLQYHPDKLRQRGESLTEKNKEAFRKIKEAYEVLSSPKRRKVYDSLGVNGLLLKEEPQTLLANPKRAQEMYSKADKRAWFVIVLVFLISLAYLFVMPVNFHHSHPNQPLRLFKPTCLPISSFGRCSSLCSSTIP